MLAGMLSVTDPSKAQSRGLSRRAKVAGGSMQPTSQNVLLSGGHDPVAPYVSETDQALGAAVYLVQFPSLLLLWRRRRRLLRLRHGLRLHHRTRYLLPRRYKRNGRHVRHLAALGVGNHNSRMIQQKSGRAI
jgi:hypothetical protein